MLRHSWFALAMLGALATGCQQQTPAPQATPAELKVAQTTKPVEAEAATASEKQAPAQSIAAFDPPYKDRIEIFMPPNRKHAVKNSNASSEVLLRGFVNVDRPMALLVVEGRLQALAAGERRGDLEVIQIERPLVTLQRGRVRWTESLYPEG